MRLSNVEKLPHRIKIVSLSLGGGIWSLGGRIWSLPWWQALLVIWALWSVALSLAGWMQAIFLTRTPIAYQMMTSLTYGVIIGEAYLVIFVILVKGIAAVMRELRGAR